MIETHTESIVKISGKRKGQEMEYSPNPLKEAQPVTLEKNLPSLPSPELPVEDQVIPGELENPSPYETTDEKITAVKIAEIQHFTDVPDFIAPSRSKHPFVVHTAQGFFCLDGMHLVEQAKAKGKKAITCYVEYMANHSEEELAIRKVANRVVPRGGRTTYAEGVRNTKHLEEMLLTTDDNLLDHGYGGVRRGKKFLSNNQDNVRTILSERLELSRPTIDQILAHARYLKDETLNFLATEKASKDFFEEVQKNRTAITKNMVSQKIKESKITIEMSKSMRVWYLEFKRAKKITPVWITQTPVSENPLQTAAPVSESAPQDTTPTVETPPETAVLPDVAEAKEVEYKPYQGSTVDDSEDSFEKVKNDVEAIAKRLINVASIDDLDEFEERVVEEANGLIRITHRLTALKD